MLPNKNCSVVPYLESYKKQVRPSPKMQIKYTEKGNEVGARETYELCCAQERLSERMICESNRVLDEVTEITSNWKREADHQIQERVNEVQFMHDELVKQRKVAVSEEETVRTYCDRIKKALEHIDRAISTCQQCLTLRQGRIDIDLCVDEVERALQSELKAMKGCQTLLLKANKDAADQIRLLRKSIYLLDEDIAQKADAIQIDLKNIQMRKTSESLGKGIDLSRNVCKYNLSEWQEFSAENIKANIKETTSASTLRAYIDLLLNQVYEDMCNATERTDSIFKRQIEETTKFKVLLEEKHNNNYRNIIETQRNISTIEQQLVDKERSLLLCKSRLSNRARRINQEQTCDLGHQTLLEELRALELALCKLKQKLEENKAMLRCLMHTSVLTEENINIKINTLKIDEIDCMILRETLTFVPF